MSFPYIEPDPEGQTERMSQRKFSSVLSDEKLNAKHLNKIFPEHMLPNFAHDSCICCKIVLRAKVSKKNFDNEGMINRGCCIVRFG